MKEHGKGHIIEISLLQYRQKHYPEPYGALFAAKGSHVVCVFGQMNETPGCRMRVNILEMLFKIYLSLLIIFHLISAGSEGGYQPTLSTEMGMGSFQERIVATLAGCITSIQAIYVPAVDPLNLSKMLDPSLSKSIIM